MSTSTFLIFFSALFVLLAIARAAPVASDDLVARIAQPAGGFGAGNSDWKRDPQNGMGGSGKDWKREALPSPQNGFGGASKDWKL